MRNTNIINITTYILGFLQGNDMFNNTGNPSFTDEGTHYTNHSQDAKGYYRSLAHVQDWCECVNAVCTWDQR